MSEEKRRQIIASFQDKKHDTKNPKVAIRDEYLRKLISLIGTEGFDADKLMERIERLLPDAPNDGQTSR